MTITANTADRYAHWNGLLFGGHYVLSVDPVILLFEGGFQHRAESIQPPLPAGCQPDITIEMLSWWLSPTTATQFARRHEAQRDGIRRLVLTNVADEEANRLAAGVDGFCCNKEMFALDELFRPLDEERCYDAIYVGRLAPGKRHHLASQVPRLRLLTGGIGTVQGDNDLQGVDFDKLRRIGLREDVSASFSFLSLPKVCQEINRSHCGLLLSSIEGMTRASTQYLLCGRPVVSTRSQGGRAVFYDECTSLIVDDQPASVAAAVARLVEERRDPREIRARTVHRIRTWRYQFARRIAALRVEAGGTAVTPEQVYLDLFADFARLRERHLPAGSRWHDLDLTRFDYPSRRSMLAIDDADLAVTRTAEGWQLARGEAVATLGDCGAWVLSRILEGDDVDTVIARGHQHYGAATALAEDVREVVSTLIALGVVDLVEATTAQPA